VVNCGREGEKARFYAGQFDDRGSGVPVARSKQFAVELKGSLVGPTDEAMAAHEALTDQLRVDGWNAIEAGPREWYSRVLERPLDQLLGGVARESQAPRAVDSV
jgi:hypothetical protein